jgi:hypothetical protein
MVAVAGDNTADMRCQVRGHPATPSEMWQNPFLTLTQPPVAGFSFVSYDGTLSS